MNKFWQIGKALELKAISIFSKFNNNFLIESESLLNYDNNEINHIIFNSDLNVKNELGKNQAMSIVMESTKFGDVNNKFSLNEEQVTHLIENSNLLNKDYLGRNLFELLIYSNAVNLTGKQISYLIKNSEIPENLFYSKYTLSKEQVDTIIKTKEVLSKNFYRNNHLNKEQIGYIVNNYSLNSKNDDGEKIIDLLFSTLNNHTISKEDIHTLIEKTNNLDFLSVINNLSKENTEIKQETFDYLLSNSNFDKFGSKFNFDKFVQFIRKHDKIKISEEQFDFLIKKSVIEMKDGSNNDSILLLAINNNLKLSEETYNYLIKNSDLNIETNLNSSVLSDLLMLKSLKKEKFNILTEKQVDDILEKIDYEKFLMKRSFFNNNFSILKTISNLENIGKTELAKDLSERLIEKCKESSKLTRELLTFTIGTGNKYINSNLNDLIEKTHIGSDLGKMIVKSLLIEKDTKINGENLEKVFDSIDLDEVFIKELNSSIRKINNNFCTVRGEVLEMTEKTENLIKSIFNPVIEKIDFDTALNRLKKINSQFLSSDDKKKKNLN